jgi:EREBP-like factor
VEAGNPTKKLKSNSENAVPIEDNTAKSLSDELLAFDPQMPYFEGGWETSFDAFLAADNTQDGGNLWSFDDFPSIAGGVY